MRRVVIHIGQKYHPFTLYYFLTEKQITVATNYLESRLGKAQTYSSEQTDGRWLIHEEGKLVGFGDIPKDSEYLKEKEFETDMNFLLKRCLSKDDKEQAERWIKRDIAMLKKLL